VTDQRLNEYVTYPVSCLRKAGISKLNIKNSKVTRTIVTFNKKTQVFTLSHPSCFHKQLFDGKIQEANRPANDGWL